MSKKLLVTVGDSTKPLAIGEAITENGLKEAIIQRFSLNSNSTFIVQVFDDEWNTFVDVENYGDLRDRSKIRCTSISSSICSPVGSPTSPDVSVTTPVTNSAVQSVFVNAESLHWPHKFVFPIDKLPTAVSNALQSNVNLNHPKQRYLRGLLVNTVCEEAMKFKSHPDRDEKVEMAKSIVCMWPNLQESVGRGYDGWLASIVDCLKTRRRTLGKIDMSRSVAIRKRKGAFTDPENEVFSHSSEHLSSVDRSNREAESLSMANKRRKATHPAPSGSQYASQSVNEGLTREAAVTNIGITDMIMANDVAVNIGNNALPLTIPELNTPTGIQCLQDIAIHCEEQSSIAATMDSPLAVLQLSSSERMEVGNKTRKQLYASGESTESCELPVETVTSQSNQLQHGSINRRKTSSPRKLQMNISTVVLPASLTSSAAEPAVGPCSTTQSDCMPVLGSCVSLVLQETVANCDDATCDMPHQLVVKKQKQSRYSKRRFERDSQDKSNNKCNANVDDDVMTEMHTEWDKAENCRDMAKILELLKVTFDSRRQLIYGQSSTVAVKERFPALFCREGLIQEYELINEGVGCLKTAIRNCLAHAPRLVDMAKAGRPSGVKQVRNTAGKYQAISLILSALDNADIVDVDEVNTRVAVAGLMVLPLLLGDNASLLYSEYEEATPSSSFKSLINHCPHVAFVGSPLQQRCQSFVCMDGRPLLRARDPMDAFLMTYMMYFSLWIQYPKSIECTFGFIHEVLFEHKNSTAPGKLVKLVSALQH